MNELKMVLVAALAGVLIGVPGCGDDAAHSEHASQGLTADEPHADDDATERGEDGGHGDVVRLTPEQLERSGVRIEPLGGGVVATHITLPGEVGLNEDAVLHVTPRVPGIVTEVHGLLGHTVERGDLLAVLESPGLGEARIGYLQALQARAIADAELDRQRTISENTGRLLSLLRTDPTLEALRSGSAELRIGTNKGTLLSAYARVKAGEANYARERELREKGLSTQADLLAAQQAFNSSQAEYFAAFEEIDFSYRLRLSDAERGALVARSAVENAERRLHVFGLTHEQIGRIVDEPDVDVARYELAAPAGGTIVLRHITPGEMVSEEESIYTIADLRTVWLNVSVFARYVGEVVEGQEVLVQEGDRTARGVVSYVSSIVADGSRTLLARVVLDNADRSWKPGEFVTVRVETGQTAVERAVPIGAVQSYEGREVVFVQDEDGIEPVPVRLGRRNDRTVELLGDEIPIGALVVVENSFLIKAELGKGAAGHDH